MGVDEAARVGVGERVGEVAGDQVADLVESDDVAVRAGQARGDEDDVAVVEGRDHAAGQGGRQVDLHQGERASALAAEAAAELFEIEG
jgi:hypothetical protein